MKAGCTLVAGAGVCVPSTSTSSGCPSGLLPPIERSSPLERLLVLPRGGVSGMACVCSPDGMAWVNSPAERPTLALPRRDGASEAAAARVVAVRCGALWRRQWYIAVATHAQMRTRAPMEQPARVVTETGSP